MRFEIYRLSGMSRLLRHVDVHSLFRAALLVFYFLLSIRLLLFTQMGYLFSLLNFGSKTLLSVSLRVIGLSNIAIKDSVRLLTFSYSHPLALFAFP